MKKCFIFLMFAAMAACSTTEVGLICQGIDPAPYGALPNDGKDDRPGVQAAIDSKAGPVDVCLRSGTYQFTKTGGNSSLRSNSINIGKSNVSIKGFGRSTVLEFMGDGALGDWRLINIKSNDGKTPVNDIEIADLMLAGGTAVNTEEQTHLIQVGPGPINNVSLHNLWFYMPPRMLAEPQPTNTPGKLRYVERGGDCIRLLGNYQPGLVPPVDQRVQRLSITNTNFVECHRSSISLQRSVYGYVIANNIFTEVSDQHIDMEPTGYGGLGNGVIANNVFMGGYQGDWHITVTGNGGTIEEQAVHTTVNNNILIGRGITMYSPRRVQVTGNTIVAKMTSGGGAITSIKTSEEVVIANNTIVRAVGSVPGPVVRIRGHNSGFPNHINISGNILTNEVDGNIVDMESIADMSIIGNDFRFTGPTPGLFNAVMVRATGRDVDALLVSTNRIKGALANVVRVVAGPLSVGMLSMTGNMSSGVPNGLRCEGSGGFKKPIVHASNLYDGATTATVCPAARVVQQYP